MIKTYYDRGSGYYMAYDPIKKFYVPVHELLIRKKIHRPLKKGEIVHHKNEIKTDNRLSNLKLEHNYQQHAKDHGHRWAGRNNPSFNMSSQHRSSLIKAWKIRKRKFGPTGAKNPKRLKRLGYYYGKRTPH